MKLLFLTCIVFIASSTFAQSSTSKMQQPVTVNYMAYLHIVYEIKNVPSPDPDLIAQIPFETYNQLRLSSQDVEVIDPLSGYTVILYSEEKCATLKH